MLVGQLPDHQGGQRHGGKGRAQADQVGFEPVQVVALVQHHLQHTHAQHQEDQPDVVDGLVHQFFRFLAQLAPDHQGGEDADGDVDEEDPRPAVVVGDPAAGDGPDDGRHHRHHGQERQGHAPLGRRKDRQQQGLGHGVERAGDETLHGAEDHQLGHRGGDAAEKGGDDEEHHGGHEQLDLAEAARHPAGQRQGDGVAHGEGGDDPGALFRTYPEVAGDGGQGDVGDGGVEHLHEGGQGKTHRGEDQARQRLATPAARAAGPLLWTICWISWSASANW